MCPTSAHAILSYLIGVSLSEPHTSGTALQDACVCMSVCVRMAIYKKFERTETKVHVHFKFAHSHAKAFPCAMNPYLLNVTHATEDFSPCNSIPINLLSARDRLCLE